MPCATLLWSASPAARPEWKTRFWRPTPSLRRSAMPRPPGTTTAAALGSTRRSALTSASRSSGPTCGPTCWRSHGWCSSRRMRGTTTSSTSCAPVLTNPASSTSDLSADEFLYTSLGGATEIDGVDDQRDMEETCRTFTQLGLKEEFLSDVFKVLAAILHLGNITISTNGDRSSVSASDEHLGVFCELMCVSAENVCRWLCHRRLVLAAETVVSPVAQERAVNARDALAKHIYAHLFDGIIQRINAALRVPGKQHSFIGVLDIYGFETFEVNSFEQFCINYANEKLQHQFNLHVFKLEQEEYMKEDIPWTLIDFYDNQPIIDLIEAKMGILDLLDEECLLPQGTEQNWLQKLQNYLGSNPLFDKPRLSSHAFVIQHFADKVEYQCKGFLEKNRDTLYEELVDIMKASKFSLLAEFFKKELETSTGKSIRVKAATPGVKPANKQLRTTVGDKFRSSLYLLMETLNATTPHYVRCIKPNDDKQPFEYDSKRVVQQLRACGVLETIHISAQSYPSRWTYIEFYSRYGILMMKAELALNDKKMTSKTVLQRLIRDSNQYKFGRTKIFLRAGQVAYLEKLRLDRQRAACVTIQSHVRGWMQRRVFLRIRNAVLTLQMYIRGQRRIRQNITAMALKRAWAAVVIQKHVRGHLVRRMCQMLLRATVTIQAYVRGWRARKQYKKLVEEQKALVLQKYARAWLARKRFQTVRRLVQNVQLSYRVQQLRKKLDEQNKENRGLMERLTGLANSHSQGLDKVQLLEAELKKSANEKVSLEKQEKKNKEEANQIISDLQSQKADMEVEKTVLERRFSETTQQLRENFSSLQRKLQEDLEKEERFRKIAENNLEILREDSAKEVEMLKLENRRLREETLRLHAQIEEERQANSDLQEQLTQLAKHVKVLPELRKDLHNVQTQKMEQERKMREQTHQAKVKMNAVIRQLLGNSSMELISQYSILSAAESSEDAEEDGNLLMAFDGLQKATRVMETQVREQRESFESRMETLSFKNDHLQKENEQLQKLFNEKSNINESIGQEVARLTAENMMIPEMRQQVGELNRQKQELETQLWEQTSQMMGQIEEVSAKLRADLEEERARCRSLEEQLEELSGIREEAQQRLQEEQREKEQRHKQQQAEHEAKSKLRQEVSRLTAENMDLEELLDVKERLIIRLQDQVRSLQAPDRANQRLPPTLPREYLGMLEYRREDEPKIIQNLVLDLKPRGVVVNMIPGLAAHLLFMCVRYADYLNDGSKLKSLMNAIIGGVKQITKNHQEDFELLSFWLSNTCHLLNCLKQYSGEEEFMKHNTPRQNKNCLTNFDLSEHRQIFSDIAIRIYHQIVAVMEKALVPTIVPGMLEHESLAGGSAAWSLKPGGMRKRSSSVYEMAVESCNVGSILALLSGFHATMLQHGMDPDLVRQVVRQLFYLLGSTCLNSILLRKDLCSSRKGMQIRCNISYLEEWLKEKGLQGSTAMETLLPLSQVAWLLQVSKSTDEDALEITEHCQELSPVQIVKILNSYTPIDDFEKRVAPTFVRKVQTLLQERDLGSSQLMLDTQYRFQVTFPFNPSPHALELLQVPSSLRLPFITRI
ncbi:unconventional myosin-Vc isoform X2 [Engraulis encrasicolus]|uniref:unconventional myosin-Vc isoform X2 n=1 Tax=Engraulis encrasicolus TaxID=184585 RepID=UPI002FD6C7CA